MYSLRMFTSSMHELLGVTILPLHGMQDEVSSSLSTSMYHWKIVILSSWEVGMAILQECIEVGGDGHTSSYIP
jgi:hypothetical protein